VASVKANTSGDLERRFRRPGTIGGDKRPLRAIIRYAYQLPDYQVEGGPRWTSERYDIVAKAEENAERAHAPDAADAVGGALQAGRPPRDAKVRRSTSCSRAATAAWASGSGARRSTARRTAGAAGTADPKTPCGYFGPAPDVSILSGILGFRGMSLDTFARSLTPLVQRPIVNKTGLDGFFDADFDAPAEILPPPPPPGVPIRSIARRFDRFLRCCPRILA
jgi:hypothetical protein